MSCRGVHFALSPEQEAKVLVAVGDDGALLEVVQEDIEASWDEEWLCETDKAWDAIHRCLTDGRLAVDNGEPPLNVCILGGRQLYSGDDYFVCYVPKAEVPAVAAALDVFSREDFDAAYSRLNGTDYEGRIGEDDREYTWSNLGDLKAFWRRAAVAGRPVVFTVDQ